MRKKFRDTLLIEEVRLIVAAPYAWRDSGKDAVCMLCLCVRGSYDTERYERMGVCEACLASMQGLCAKILLLRYIGAPPDTCGTIAGLLVSATFTGQKQWSPQK